METRIFGRSGLSLSILGFGCGAVGGLMGERVVLVMPGSRAAVRLAMEKIILPEIGHLVREARKRT